ncbi:MAG TPA: hypothetical protein VMK32_05435 [Burkholderiaceae bacterium]|nr:hypothetical protein [Burkholderiaceae bacterium]
MVAKSKRSSPRQIGAEAVSGLLQRRLNCYARDNREVHDEILRDFEAMIIEARAALGPCVRPRLPKRPASLIG